MSWSFALFLVLLVATLIAFVVYRKSKDHNEDTEALAGLNEDTEALAGLTTVVGAILAGLMLLTSSVWFVPVQNVGIVTAFGAPTGRTTGSGLKFTWPWEKVADFDASIQTSDHTTRDRCTTVRIGSLATACVENRVQWAVRQEAAPKLYRDYKGDFNNLRNNFVETKIQNALNTVFATYNPLNAVNLQTGQTEFDGAKHAKSLEDELNRTIGSDILVRSVTVPLIHHDEKTEQNIKQFQDVIAQSRILEQQRKNADLEKSIADLQRSYLTDEFIRNKCLELSEKMGTAPGLCMISTSLVTTPAP